MITLRPIQEGTCQLSTFCIQSGEITQHLASIVKGWLRRRWRGFAAWLDEHVWRHLLEDEPVRVPAPASCEMQFMKLHAEGRFEEMWEMLAEDAQRAWGGIQAFVREMPRLDEWLEILDMQVASVTLLDSWTDHQHEQTYNNVARLVMRYRVRQQWREWTFDRQVHLIPADDGWRTLCYPTRAGAVATR